MAQGAVLIVSNTSFIREVFHDIFLTAGYECLLAADGREGIEIFQGWRPSLVVTDLNLPDVSGIELLQQVRRQDPHAAVIVVTGSVDVESIRSACLELGAYALLQKPMDMEELLAAAAQAIEPRQIARRERQLRLRWAFPRSHEGGKLLGHPGYSDRLDQYLLTGFASCAVCGGAIAADARVHGTAPNKRLVRLYGCTFHRRRGDAICTNAVLLRQEVLDHAILQAISEVLDERILDAAVDKALEKLRAGQGHDLNRRTQIERELSLIAARMDRAMDALLNGGPKDELIARLNVEKSRKETLTDELAKLDHLTSVVSIDAARLKRDLRCRVSDVKALLGRHTPQARQMLRKLLAGKIALEPVAAGRQRGYRVRGALAIGRLLTAEALETITGRTVVTPGGPRAVGEWLDPILVVVEGTLAG